jgi:hypothetical protein
MLRKSHSIDEPPRRITVQSEMIWSVHIGTAFGARLTAGQLFLQQPWTNYKEREPWFHRDHIAWRGFFKQFHNVKVLRVGCDLLLELAYFLLLNSGEPPLLLPALEEIELCLAVPNVVPLINDTEREEVHSTLNLFVDARQRVGHPVRISLNTDPALPTPYW